MPERDDDLAAELARLRRRIEQDRRALPGWCLGAFAGGLAVGFGLVLVRIVWLTVAGLVG